MWLEYFNVFDYAFMQGEKPSKNPACLLKRFSHEPPSYYVKNYKTVKLDLYCKDRKSMRMKLNVTKLIAKLV